MATQQQQQPTKPVKHQHGQHPQGKHPHRPKQQASGKPNSGPTHFSFHKINYQLLGLGMAVVAIGFILMAGGGTTDPKVFDYNVIYSHTRVDVAPSLVILGFVINIIAIMYKPKVEITTLEEESK